MVVLEKAPVEAEATKEKLVPANAVLLSEEGLDGGAGESVVGEGCVVDPTIDACDKEIQKDFASAEGSTAGAKRNEQVVVPGDACWVRALQGMRSILLGYKTSGAAVAVSDRVFVNAFTRREEVVKELDHKGFLGVATVEGLSVRGPVHFGECLWGPHGRCTNVLLKGCCGGSLADNLFDFGRDGPRGKMELNWIGAKADGTLRGRGGYGVKVASEVVGVDIELCEERKIGVEYGFVLMAFDVGDFRGGAKEKGISD